MSTSENSHVQGAKAWTQIGGPIYLKHAVYYTLEAQERLIRCPCRRNVKVQPKGKVTRLTRGVPVGRMKDVFFETRIPRVYRPDCDKVRQINIGFARDRRKYSKAFEKEVLLRVKDTSILKVADALGVDWHTIHLILIDYLKRRYLKINLKGLEYIAIDETRVGRGYKYLTIVLDLRSGNPVFIGDGKSEDYLIPFWKLLGRRAKEIKAVCLDMGPAHQKAVREHLPDAYIVFDRFHVYKLMTEKTDRLRRTVFAKASIANKIIIAGTRFLLLKNANNLEVARNEVQRLKRVLALNTPLTKAYILKESLRRIWEQKSRREAKSSLKGWVKIAYASGIRILQTVPRTVEKYSERILNYYIDFLTSGPIEGFNNKVKALIRRAYGYRNMNNFKLMLLGINEFDPRRL
ncbi:MAG: ISL3 family transposase [Deltaproteobacteria bacterium]|jgi:transposase|nr:ISL3 family transposase [Deltaproteobacteria bacterium]